jgi:hypothetical protein
MVVERCLVLVYIIVTCLVVGEVSGGNDVEVIHLVIDGEVMTLQQSEKYQEDEEIRLKILEMKSKEKSIVIFDPLWCVYDKKYRNQSLFERYYSKIHQFLIGNKENQPLESNHTQISPGSTAQFLINIYIIEFHDWTTRNKAIDEWFENHQFGVSGGSYESYFKYGGKLSWPRICFVKMGQIMMQFLPCSDDLMNKPPNDKISYAPDHGLGDWIRWEELVEFERISTQKTKDHYPLYLSDELLKYTYTFLYNDNAINSLQIMCTFKFV